MKRHTDFAISEAPLELGSAELQTDEPVSGVRFKLVEPAVNSILEELPAVERSEAAADGLCKNDRFFISWPMDRLSLPAGSVLTLTGDPHEARSHLEAKGSNGEDYFVERSILVTLTKITGQNDAVNTRRSI